MNWLAHIFLSEQNVDFQIGNYLADPLKGRVWENASYDLKKGMQIHKIIDSYTDAHIQFKKSKDSLRDKGLLRAIIVDITYDYLLTKNWNTFCSTPIDEFTSEFYKQAEKRTEFLSLKANESLNRFIQRDVLNRYQSLENLKTAFERLDYRLSKRLLARDTASSYYASVENNINSLEKDFLIFFPQLCQVVKSNINEKNIAHWKI